MIKSKFSLKTEVAPLGVQVLLFKLTGGDEVLVVIQLLVFGTISTIRRAAQLATGLCRTHTLRDLMINWEEEEGQI